MRLQDTDENSWLRFAQNANQCRSNRFASVYKNAFEFRVTMSLKCSIGVFEIPLDGHVLIAQFLVLPRADIRQDPRNQSLVKRDTGGDDQVRRVGSPDSGRFRQVTDESSSHRVRLSYMVAAGPYAGPERADTRGVAYCYVDASCSHLATTCSLWVVAETDCQSPKQPDCQGQLYRQLGPRPQVLSASSSTSSTPIPGVCG